MGYSDFTSMTKAGLTQHIPGGNTKPCSDSHLSVVLVVLVLLPVLEVGVLPGTLRRQEGRRARTRTATAATAATASAAMFGPNLGR